MSHDSWTSQARNLEHIGKQYKKGNVTITLKGDLINHNNLTKTAYSFILETTNDDRNHSSNNENITESGLFFILNILLKFLN